MRRSEVARTRGAGDAPSVFTEVLEAGDDNPQHFHRLGSGRGAAGCAVLRAVASRFGLRLVDVRFSFLRVAPRHAP